MRPEDECTLDPRAESLPPALLPTPSHYCPAPVTIFPDTSLGDSPGSAVTLMCTVPRVLSVGHVWQGHKLCVGIRRPVCKTHCAMEARWPDAPQCPPEPEPPHLQKEGLKRGSSQNLNLHRCAVLRLSGNQLLLCPLQPCISSAGRGRGGEQGILCRRPLLSF